MMDNLILKYDIFLEEVRLGNIAKIIGTGITYDISKKDDEKFLKFKTLSKRINNEKIRLEINWNHSLKHDLLKRLKERTSLQNIEELNLLISKGLDEMKKIDIRYGFLSIISQL